MVALPPAIQATLAALVIVAAVYDLYSRRIPNWLTVAALLVAVALSAILGGSVALTSSLLGAAIAFATYFALFALRAMGGGDVKLMTAVGALTGPSNWLIVFVFTAIIGGLLALALVAARGSLRHTLANVLFVLGEFVHLRAPYHARPGLDVAHPGAARLPHAISIASGALLFLIVVHTLMRALGLFRSRRFANGETYRTFLH